VHVQVAAEAVPIGFKNARARWVGELFTAGRTYATPEPLVLLSEPLTTLTATSEFDGLSADDASELELEHATGAHASAMPEAMNERFARERRGIMIVFSWGRRQV
jgi:hypothetical protein